MTPQCHIRLDSYKKNFFSGFLRLQHDEEFVDMTLATEGHLIQVHRNILALASPYIKEVLQTTPCSHPVVFLTQIKKEILGYILEYVYTGEVQVPSIRMASFIEAAKALHIIGLENMIPPIYSASYQSEVLKTLSDRNKTEQNKIHSLSKVPETNAETYTTQPSVTLLPEHNTSANDMSGDKNTTKENNAVGTLQTSQTVQSCEQNMGISKVNHELTEEIYNENCANIPREIKIDLDAIDTNIQPENSKSDLGINNVTTAIATYNDTQNVKELWSDDDTISVMDYMSDETKDIEHKIVCPSINMGNETNLKNTEIVTALNLNESTLFDFEAAINSSTSVNPFCKDLQQSTSNNSFTGKNMETSVIDQALPEPVVPHNNQHFSFEITASGAESDTGKPMTITINPIRIEPKQNSETKEAALTHDCSSPLYTVSKRGKLMLILNRYMYNLHHSTQRKRRWRCIDYYRRGKQSCKAYVDTENEMVISRKFMHDHPFHDKKIFTKGHTGNIYTSIKDASNQKDILDV